jgi:pescadillo protein
MAKHTPTNNTRKPNKGNKGPKKQLKLKKNTRGEATQFITRSKAIRRLGLTLKDFRRICILKGIYPREPNKKIEGAHKTYYHRKDITYLAHDDMINSLRQQKVISRKIKKATRENNVRKIKNLKKMKPEITLTRIVRERYPAFEDALRDLEDPLNLINTFAVLPAHRIFKVPPVIAREAEIVKRQFNNYVIRSHSLQKAFLSIKGIYYEADVQGHRVLWLEPYRLSQTLPYNVDYKVMMTFLEFYITMLKFTMFKLYRNLNLVYPPHMTPSDQPFSYADMQNQAAQSAEDQLSEKYQVSEEFKQEEIVQKILGQNKNTEKKLLLEGLTFFISNEVFREPFEFIILSLGGKVLFHEDNFESAEYKNKSITHVLTERQTKELANR